MQHSTPLCASARIALALVAAAPVSLAGGGASATPAPNASTTTWGDFDSDGLQDALFLQPGQSPRLLRGKEGGLLDDISELSGLSEYQDVHGAAWADFDADGLQDLFLVSHTGGGRLLRQARPGQFEAVTERFQLQPEENLLDATWIDYDGDGRPDLHTKGIHRHRLYRNNARAFVEVDLNAGRLTTQSLTTIGGGFTVAGAGSLSGGSSSLFVPPVAGSLVDQANPTNQLKASSVATIGMLFPLGTDLYIDSTTGNVGLGTLSPQQALDVEGTIRSRTGGVIFPDGSLQSTATLVGPQGLTGPAGADGDDGAQGTQGLTGPAGADGNDGAQGTQGLTGPAGADGNDGAQGTQGLTGPAGADGNDGAQGIAGPPGMDGSAGDTHWPLNGASTYYNSGNVGIGTSNPQFPLHINSTGFSGIYARSTATSGYAWGGSFSSSSTDGKGIVASASATSGDTYGVIGSTQSTEGTGVEGKGWSFSGVNYGVRGVTNSDDGYAGHFTGGKNYFEGNVGLGTDNPQYPLHIDSSGYSGIYARSTATTGYAWGGSFSSKSTDGKGIVASASATTGDTYGVIGTSHSVEGTGVQGKGWAFSGVNYGVMGITNSDSGFAGHFTGGKNYFEGRVGMGTTSPLAQLQVDSDTQTDPFRVRVGGGTKLIVKSNGNTAIGSNSTPNFQLEIFGTGTAGKPGGGSWSNSSDRRLKKNILDLDGSLDRLLKLRGVTYEYKDPEAINELPGTRTGMIAQEVEEVFPDWVGTSGLGYKMLTFRGFEALTVEALRELREETDAKLDELRTENIELRGRLARLEQMVESLTIAPGSRTGK